MKRVDLNSNYGEFQADTSVELPDEEADGLIKRGRAVLSAEQRIYNHIDEMAPALQKRSVELLKIANKAGGPRDQSARAAALAAHRK